MKTADHFPPQTHQELVLETKKHKRIWDGVVRRSNGLYVSGTNPQDLFDGMTTAGKIPYVTSLEGWSETYDESETPYDKGAKEIASIGVVQAGGWNWETPWNSSHNWKFNGVPKDRGLTDEGKEWYRALGANGVTLWDGSHESNGSIIDKVRLAKEKNQSHVRVLVSHAGVQMGRVVEKTRNPSKEAIEELLADGNSFFGIATSTSMLPGNNAEAVADAAEYLLDLDPTKGKQIGLGFDTNGKGGGTILEDVPTMLHLQKIAEAMYKRPRLRDLVEDIMWRNYASFLLNAMQARAHAA
jgi:microsomal dipeptidase-like Zn-dependent dipeptidase